MLVLIPTNTGYIHPDEHFQTIEVIAGDVLELDTHRTWEFNVTAPLRSPSVSYGLFGVPLTLLKFSADKVSRLCPYVVNLETSSRLSSRLR